MLLTIRAFFTSIFIILLTGVMSLFAIATMPLSPRGDFYLYLANLWSRIIFLVGGIDCRVELSPRIAELTSSREQPSFLYLSNHQSLTDILALFVAVPQKVVMVAKRSLLILPVFSWSMWLAGFVFINRRDRESAYRSMSEAGQKIRRGRSVLVFPEGTRGAGDELRKFKRGGFVLAQSAQIPVVPVGIHGTSKVLPRDRFNVYPGRIAVCIGDPIPAPPAGMPIEEWMEQVRTEVDRLRLRAVALVEGSASTNSTSGPQDQPRA